MNRAVSFEYMNHLVWNEFSEMLLLLLPLLNSSSFEGFFSPFSENKSSSSPEENGSFPICLSTPSIPFLAHSCQQSSIIPVSQMQRARGCLATLIRISRS